MEAPLLHLALVGTPNSGKTSLFNALTGSRQKVANYPGVTVERKEGFFVTPQGRQVSVVDLPGTYSLRGRSPDEEITRDFVLGKATGETVPDLVLCVADSTNLRLTIRLLLELKGKLGPEIASTGVAIQSEAQGDIVQALIALGYNEKEAAMAIKGLPKDIGVSDGIKLAMKALS